MIALLPLGKVNDQLLDELRSRVSEELREEVVIGGAEMNVESARDERRNQYNSTHILLQLRVVKHSGFAQCRKLLSVFPHDLFIPVLTFVFGEAELSGDVGIVSYYRLENERYGLSPDPTLLTERLVKESLHEIGHLYGLVHCRRFDCVMRASTSVEDIDLKPGEFCDSCRRAVLPVSV